MILIKEHEEREQTMDENDQDQESGELLDDFNANSVTDRIGQEVMLFKADLKKDEKVFFNKRKQERKSWLSEFLIYWNNIKLYFFYWFSESFVSGISRFFFGQ